MISKALIENKLQRMLLRLLPFLLLGLGVTFLVVGILIISYTILIGATVGLAIGAAAYVRSKLRRHTVTRLTARQRHNGRGRVIDQHGKAP